MIGMAIAEGLEERGQAGATHMGTGYDAWYPGYIDYMPVFKNIPAFWTETFGPRCGADDHRARTDSRATCAARSRSTRARGPAVRGGCATRSSTCTPRRWR